MIFNFAAGLLLPPLSGVGWHWFYRIFRVRASVLSGWMCSAVVGGTYSVIQKEDAFAAGGGISLMIALAIWLWRRREGRKRAPKALGYKARALVAALVQRAREAAQPRPVLKPQRGGAL